MPEFNTMEGLDPEEGLGANEDGLELNEGQMEAVASELDHIEEALNSMSGEDSGDGEALSDIETYFQEIDRIFESHPDYIPLLDDRSRAESKMLQGDSEAERQEGADELIEWVEKTRELL